jgi:transposase InsO family protein
MTTITGLGITQLYMDHVYRWFGLPTKIISDRNPRFTSHFGKSLAQQLKINQNLSSAFHPQMDGISERKNQWIEQYLRLVTSTSPEDWTHWLAIATMVHNNRRNETTRLSPNQILLGYEMTLQPEEDTPSNNEAVETRVQNMREKRAQVVDTINQMARSGQTITSQYK